MLMSSVIFRVAPILPSFEMTLPCINDSSNLYPARWLETNRTANGTNDTSRPARPALCIADDCDISRVTSVFMPASLVEQDPNSKNKHAYHLCC